MKRIWILAVLLILTACAAPIPTTPTAVLTSTPSSTPSATLTETSTPSPTASPTITTTHTPTIEPAAGTIMINSFSQESRHAYRVRSDGSGFTHLFAMPDGTGTPAWSPDGRLYAFPRSSAPPLYEEEIVITDADTNNEALVVNAAAIFADISWSPDGKQLAFYYAPPGPLSGIFTVDINGSSFMQISQGTDRCPAWSPDGEQIVFFKDVRFMQDKNTYLSHLFVAKSNGDMNEYQLTDESLGDAGCPAWSPDGELIAFYIVDDEKSAIYTIRPDGSDLRQLTDAANKNAHPAWSPDGSQIAFVSDREGYDAIYIMNADGSGALRITDKITEIGVYTLGKLNWLADEQ